MDQKKALAAKVMKMTMRGIDLKNWRKRNQYNQESLMQELGIRSRQTISSLENSDKEISRMLELALIALEKVPESRNIHGKRADANERKKFKIRQPVPKFSKRM